MNSDETVVPHDAAHDDEANASALPSSDEGSQASRGTVSWADLAIRLLVCNPFYLCSAALLLYGINRLSVDPGFLADEKQNLLFNFGALQLYEFLVVGTAIVLAGRKIWYDSALLVVVENGLVLIPFMLISQATLIDKGLAWTLSVAGALAVAGRFYAVRGKYPQFNAPARALLLGALILVCNVALPHAFRPWVEGDLEEWAGPNRILWYVALPLIAAGANLLPRATRYGGANPERSWLPLFNYGLWIAGSAVHVWCLAYICKLPFQLFWLAPAAWVCAWTLWNRLSDCLSEPPVKLQIGVLSSALLFALLAVERPLTYALLSGLNVVGFVALWSRGQPALRSPARELALLSAVLLFAGMPGEWLPPLSRGEQLFGAAVLYALLLALRSDDPRIGALGAAAVALAAGWLARDWAGHAAAQASLAFLLIHSLRWSKEVHKAAVALRTIIALLWMVDAIVWTHRSSWAEGGFVAATATVVLIAWAIHARRRGQLVLLVPASSGIVLVSGPADWLVFHSPAGLLALAGSLVLFGLGTFLAWTRPLWERGPDPPEH